MTEGHGSLCARLIMAALLPGIVVGCGRDVPDAMNSNDGDTKQSRASAEAETTYLEQTARSLHAGHGEDSGFLLMDRGRTALAWRAILADAAERSIDAQYFLWKDDEAGKVMMQRLMAAADRGVHVRVLIDDSMTESNPEYLARFGAHPNIEVRLYKPFGPKHKSTVMRWIDYAADLKVLNRRMHNKLYVVDGSFAIAGGRNIGSEYFEYPVPFVFRSRDLLAVGPVVETAKAAFGLYWDSDWTVPIEDVVKRIPTADDVRAFKRSLDEVAALSSSYPPGFNEDSAHLRNEMATLVRHLHWGKAHLLVDAVPEKNGHAQTHAELDRTGVVLGRIARETTRELHVQSAYLILLPPNIQHLSDICKRGVVVKMATNSMASNNHLAAFVGYRKQRKKLLEIGAELYEMRPDAAEQRALFTDEQLAEHEMFFGLHAKTAVFDRKITFVGSFNLDPRSMDLNTEMGWLVESNSLAEAVARSIENDIAAGNSWQVVLNDKRRPEWISVVDGEIVIEAEKEPMTTAKQRAEADALAVVPDDSQL
jgi:putative cardiolipin synthase